MNNEMKPVTKKVSKRQKQRSFIIIFYATGEFVG
jgi:hypothetical protein